MTFQRATFLAAAFLIAQHPQDVSGFGVNNPIAAKRFTHQTKSAIAAEPPSPYEKAAELRKKAEAAKLKAEGLKKVAEQKAEAAMLAVKRANDKNNKAKEIKEPVANVPAPAPPAAPTDKASTRKASDPSEEFAIVPINAANVEFTSGILGGAFALALGASPILAVVAAAAANYVSKKEDLGEVNELVQGISKASLTTVNWFAKLDSKYTVVSKLSDSLDKSLDDLKNSDGESKETVQKLEENVTKTSNQIMQLVNDFDLLEGGKQALGAIGEVIEASVDKAFDANNEYKLTERATGAAKKAIENAKDSKK